MKILHLEDNPNDAALLRDLLETEWPDVVITLVGNRPDFEAALADASHDLIISDFRLPSFNGRDALALARERRPEIPFIFVSGTVGEDVAAEIVRAGAADYLLKDRTQRLPIAIRRALHDNEARREHRLAEQRIREQAELLDHARDGIIVTNLDDRITFWNQGAERILGWPAAEALGRKPAELFARGLEPELAAMHRQLELTDEWHGELSLVGKPGRRLPAEVRITLVRDSAGRPKSRLKIVTDITEKKRLEESFLRAQRLESLGLLAAGIAHDLNNILAPVLMGAPLLRSFATDPADVRVLDAIEQSAARGAALVRQILSFAHGASANKTLVQPKHLLLDIATLIRQTFPKSIELDSEIPNDLRTVHGNPTQLHQVVLNLCVNARDAMPAGGRLRLTAGNRGLDAAAAQALPGARPGDYTVIEVRDTGTGIAPEILARIWEPFFTTKGEDKGTGLGLATVRGIAENHGGFVTVDSEPGRGTTFRVFLPAAEAADPAARSGGTTQPFAPRGNGELILVVDDEESIRMLSTAILHRHGYRVLTAVNGTEALSLFIPRASEVSLVITDLHMPEMGGAALAKVLPSLNPAIKILFTSGAGTGPDNNEPLPASARVFKKPFTVGTLLVAVRDILDAPPPAAPPKPAGES